MSPEIAICTLIIVVIFTAGWASLYTELVADAFTLLGALLLFSSIFVGIGLEALYGVEFDAYDIVGPFLYLFERSNSLQALTLGTCLPVFILGRFLGRRHAWATMSEEEEARVIGWVKREQQMEEDGNVSPTSNNAMGTSTYFGKRAPGSFKNGA